MSPETGRRFGPYEVQSRLGGGGMGHVYRAWDARLHREVAIKLLNHEYVMPGMRERFLREARAASALNHPNICTIFDIGEQDGDPYLVMELLEGETLKDRIQERSMQIDEIVAVSRESAEALGAAHAKGVVHRDVKPANIFLVNKPNGGVQAKVLDFGLAKIDGGVLGPRGRSLELTTVGSTVGTLAYMSPEQARGEVLDSRSDLFSLGVVMYEMATRQVPFQGATSALVFVQLLNHPPEPVRDWNDAVPRDLEKIILKLLAKERTARYQTARELELALVALGDKGPGGWLRKAVSTVPLVKAPDPIAREKRLSRDASASRERVRLSALSAQIPAADPAAASSASVPAAGDQIIRPVTRLPRTDAAPNVPRRTSGPEGSAPGRFTPPSFVAKSPFNSSPEVYDLQSGSHAAHSPASQSSAHDDVSSSVIPAAAAAERERHLPAYDAVPKSAAWYQPTPGAGTLFHRWGRISWVIVGILAVVALAALIFVVVTRLHFGAPVLSRTDALVVTEVENRTGDASFDGSVAEGLRLALAQSPYLLLRDGSAYRAGRHSVSSSLVQEGEGANLLLARRTADRLGAKAYAYGVLSGSAFPYTLHVDIRDVGSNETLISTESRAENLQQVAEAIDAAALRIRSTAGEPRLSIDQAALPLAHEATSSVSALHHFSLAEVSLSAGNPLAAITDLQQALVLDPRFTQAHLALATLYRDMHAESASADSARLALAASDGASERTRTLAQAAYETETNGDYQRAANLLHLVISNYPHDSMALASLAHTLTAQGHLAESLQIAQEAYADDPFNTSAYSEAEQALLGLDRYDAAFQLEAQAQHLGILIEGGALTTAFLDGRRDAVSQILQAVPSAKSPYVGDISYGMFLDNEGRLSAGAAFWQMRSIAAGQVSNLKSAQVFLLAKGAADRALVGDCRGSIALRAQAPDNSFAGRKALFNLALADALCGDATQAETEEHDLQQRFSKSFEVNNFFVPDLQAAIMLRRGSPAMALDALRAAQTYDLISLTPYLRGLAHVAIHQVELGIVDFQTVLSHRGLSFLTGDTVYPAAQLGVARAFASSGDLGNSAEAYRRFLALWSTADPGSSALNEAKLHANS